MSADALGRRLRFAPPNAVCRRLVLTTADYLIFEAINRHGPLPTHYLYQFTKHLRRDYTHLQNRLTEFYNGDGSGPLLSRPHQQFAGFQARYQHTVYDLAPRARVLLAERGITSRDAPRRAASFLHQLMQACIGATFELVAPSKGLRYIPRREILAHPRCPEETRNALNPLAIPISGRVQKTLIPDDLFGIEYPNVGFRFFAVEADRNTESIERKNLSQSAFGQKIAGYVDILHNQSYRGHWGVPNFHILTITTNATHVRNLLAHVQRHVEPKYAMRFAFKCEQFFGDNWSVPKVMLSKLVEEPWHSIDGYKNISQAYDRL